MKLNHVKKAKKTIRKERERERERERKRKKKEKNQKLKAWRHNTQ